MPCNVIPYLNLVPNNQGRQRRETLGTRLTIPLVANTVNSKYERHTMGELDALNIVEYNTAFLYTVWLYVLWFTNIIYDNGLHVHYKS